MLDNTNQFMRDGYRRMLTALVALMLSATALIGVYILVGTMQDSPRYYASTTTGEVIGLEALSSPVVTSEFIQQWSQTVARKAYTLNFLSFEKQLQDVRPYFSADGWSAFQASLAKVGLIDKIQQEKLYLSAVANGPVVILNRYVSHGSYSWDVQLPMLILFSSSSMQVKKQIYVGMTIKRVPELGTPQGIAVTQFVMGGLADDK